MGQGDLMTCPICEFLNREYDRECQIEGAAILKERSESLRGPQRSGRESGQNVAEVVLESRKRQMQLASKLQLHRAEDHAS